MTARLLLALTVQLALLTLLVYRLELVSQAFVAVATLALLAFPVHRMLPPDRRAAFFLAVSLAGLGLAVGWRAGLWVALLGTGLIAMAHLPISMARRCLALLAVFGALVAVRAGWIPPGPLGTVPPLAWAVLGSMFMFRLPLYLHDLAHRRPDFQWARTGSYFFLLPNSCFLLFPVVDHQVFRTGLAEDEDGRIAQRGLTWMLHGVIHLLLYRAVERHLLLPATEVETVAELGRYLTANVALFLRVSGHFHLAIGMLGLFGFGLPRTHDRYFLAHDAGDYWRRINIYWKDFMTKTVYFPVFFALRRRATSPWQQRRALATATAAVFAVSWFLHGYQWLWLLGAFPLRLQDALFWGLVGLWVVIFTLRRKESGVAPPPTGWRRGVKILLTFTTVATLWSLWTAESPAELARLWRAAVVPPRSLRELSWLLAPAGVLGAWLVGRRLQSWLIARSPRGGSGTEPMGLRAPQGRLTTVGALGLLALFALPSGLTLFGGPRSPEPLTLWADLGSRHLAATDAARLERGYYEKVLRVNRLDSPLLQGLAAAGTGTEEVPAAAEARDAEGRALFEERHTFRRFHLLPDRQGKYLGKAFTTGPRGLRSQGDTTAAEGLGDPFTIAVLGSSHVLGHGVADDETFVAHLEERLRWDGLPGGPGSRGEGWRLLNFAGIGTSPPQMLHILEEDVLGGGVLGEPPDAVLWVAHTSDALWTKRQLAWILVHDIPLPWPGLEELVRRAGIDDTTPNPRIQKRLSAASHPVVAWAYQQAARSCRERGVSPLWVLLPKLREHGRRRLIPGLTAAARQAGFEVLEIGDVFAGVPPAELQVGATDFHPNARGHRRIADALYRQLTQRPEVLTDPVDVNRKARHP